MSTSVSVIRQAVETRLLDTALSGGQTLVLSEKPAPFIRNVVRSPAHLEYSVGTNNSTAKGDRQKPGATILADTVLQVSFWWNMAAHDQDIDALLDVEDAIRSRVLSRDGSYPGEVNIVWLRSTRSAEIPGWIFCESEFSALHYCSA